MNINAIFLTMCMVVVKKSQPYKVNAFDICMFRSFTNTILSIPVIYSSKKHPVRDVTSGLGSTLVTRCFIGSFGFMMLVFEAMWLPVFIAQTMNNTMPFFTSIFGFLVNGEKLRKEMLFCMIGCFAGVLILNLFRPDKQNVKDFQNFNYGMASAFSFIICGSMVAVLNRKMKSIHFSIIQFDYALFAWLSMLVVISVEYLLLKDDKQRYPYDTLRILTYDLHQWYFLFMYAAANFLVQFSFNIGSTRGKSAFVSLIAQIGVVWSFLADTFIVGTSTQPMQILGALIIVGFNVTAVLI